MLTIIYYILTFVRSSLFRKIIRGFWQLVQRNPAVQIADSDVLPSLDGSTPSILHCGNSGRLSACPQKDCLPVLGSEWTG